MREIKFRAWDKENEIYLYNVQNTHDTVYDECCFGDFLDNKRYDVEQFTGLTDMNGKEIYEGDVVNVTWSRDDTEGENYVIAYDPNNDGYPTFDFVDWYEDMNGLSYAYIDGQITVIGNQFENPELLKDE